MNETGRLRPYWCSFYHTADIGSFTMHNPWWRSGFRCDDWGDTPIVVCAIMGESEDDAKARICASFDNPPHVDIVDWRFIETIERDNIFSDRFPRRDWMIWDE